MNRSYSEELKFYATDIQKAGSILAASFLGFFRDTAIEEMNNPMTSMDFTTSDYVSGWIKITPRFWSAVESIDKQEVSEALDVLVHKGIIELGEFDDEEWVRFVEKEDVNAV